MLSDQSWGAGQDCCARWQSHMDRIVNSAVTWYQRAAISSDFYRHPYGKSSLARELMRVPVVNVLANSLISYLLSSACSMRRLPFLIRLITLPASPIPNSRLCTTDTRFSTTDTRFSTTYPCLCPTDARFGTAIRAPRVRTRLEQNLLEGAGFNVQSYGEI